MPEISHDEGMPIIGLLEDIFRIREAVGTEPAVESPADIEQRSFVRKESVRTAHSQAGLILEAAADHLEALELLVASKELAVAPWTTARATLEACALVIWLLDQEIDTKERVGRSLSLRYKALRSQEKIARATNDQINISSIQKQMDKIEQVAISIGFSPLRKNNKRTGIAVPEPAITELVRKLVGDEAVYRILSGVAHADYATLMEISFVKVEGKPPSGVAVVRAIPHDLQKGMLANVAAAYARAAWLIILHFGGNMAEMETVLENRYDELELRDSDEIRFWRSG